MFAPFCHSLFRGFRGENGAVCNVFFAANFSRMKAGQRSAAKLIMRDEARRIAANMTKLPELQRRRKGQLQCPLLGVKQTLLQLTSMTAFDGGLNRSLQHRL